MIADAAVLVGTAPTSRAIQFDESLCAHSRLNHWLHALSLTFVRLARSRRTATR
jgi:hypothetical protein